MHCRLPSTRFVEIWTPPVFWNAWMFPPTVLLIALNAAVFLS